MYLVQKWRGPGSQKNPALQPIGYLAPAACSSDTDVPVTSQCRRCYCPCTIAPLFLSLHNGTALAVTFDLHLTVKLFDSPPFIEFI